MAPGSRPSGYGQALVHFPSETIHKVTVLRAPETGRHLQAWGVEEESWIIETVEDLTPRDDSEPAWEIWVIPAAQA